MAWTGQQHQLLDALLSSDLRGWVSAAPDCGEGFMLESLGDAAPAGVKAEHGVFQGAFQARQQPFLLTTLSSVASDDPSANSNFDGPTHATTGRRRGIHASGIASLLAATTMSEPASSLLVVGAGGVRAPAAATTTATTTDTAALTRLLTRDTAKAATAVGNSPRKGASKGTLHQQRQRELIAELQEVVQGRAAQLREEMQENGRLQCKQRMLESVLPLKTMQVHALQQQLEALRNQPRQQQQQQQQQQRQLQLTPTRVSTAEGTARTGVSAGAVAPFPVSHHMHQHQQHPQSLPVMQPLGAMLLRGMAGSSDAVSWPVHVLGAMPLSAPAAAAAQQSPAAPAMGSSGLDASSGSASKGKGSAVRAAAPNPSNAAGTGFYLGKAGAASGRVATASSWDGLESDFASPTAAATAAATIPGAQLHYLSSRSIAAPDAVPGSDAAGGGAAGGSATISLRQQHEGELSRMPCSNVPELLALWGVFLRDVGLHLHLLEAHCNPAAAKRIAEVTADMLNAVRAAELRDPELIMSVACVNMQTGLQEQADEAFWSSVSAQVAFKPSQIIGMRQALELHNKSCREVAVLRLGLQERLLQLLALDVATACLTGPPSCCPDTAMLKLELSTLLRGIRACFSREVGAHALVGELATEGILTPQQLCKLYVCSYPFMPNMPAIFTAALLMHDRQQAQLREQQQAVEELQGSFGTAGEGSLHKILEAAVVQGGSKSNAANAVNNCDNDAAVARTAAAPAGWAAASTLQAEGQGDEGDTEMAGISDGAAAAQQRTSPSSSAADDIT